jgi:g-D-glutamyl-meso-diaminopimelate peptidase
MNTQKNILELKTPLDHAQMMRYIAVLSERYPFLSVTVLGESILGRSIPIITLGEGKKSLVYVGSHHGMEWITSVILLRFINEFCELYYRGSKVYNYALSYLFSTRSIHIIPMLNPDGVDYQINGIGEENVLRDRLITMNHGSLDFSNWQANARGVDLNRNYNSRYTEYKRIEREMGILGGTCVYFSGEMPESEPEVGALCNFLRFNRNIQTVLTLHSQGEEIYYTSGEKTAPRSRSIGERLAKMSGYSLCLPEENSSYCGLTDWCIDELNIPSFTIECGKGKNPLPISDSFLIYAKLRELLFCMPTII